MFSWECEIIMYGWQYWSTLIVITGGGKHPNKHMGWAGCLVQVGVATFYQPLANLPWLPTHAIHPGYQAKSLNGRLKSLAPASSSMLRPLLQNTTIRADDKERKNKHVLEQNPDEINTFVSKSGSILQKIFYPSISRRKLSLCKKTTDQWNCSFIQWAWFRKKNFCKTRRFA